MFSLSQSTQMQVQQVAFGMETKDKSVFCFIIYYLLTNAVLKKAGHLQATVVRRTMQILKYLTESSFHAIKGFMHYVSVKGCSEKALNSLINLQNEVQLNSRKAKENKLSK